MATVPELERKLTLYLKRWRDYPLAFPIEACRAGLFGYPTHQQAAIFEAMRWHNFVAVRSGHNIGKSRLMAWEFWRHLFCYRLPGQPLKVVATGPARVGVEDVLWSEIGLVKSHLLPFLQDRVTMTAERVTVNDDPTNWFASIRTARREQPDALQGLHGRFLMLIDEGSGVHDSIFEVAAGAFAEEFARGLMFGNPVRDSGYFYRIFQPGLKSRWHCMHFSSEDSLTDTEYKYKHLEPTGEVQEITVNGRCARSWVEGMASEHGADSVVYGVRVKGEFPGGKEKDLLIRRDWIEKVYNTDQKEEPSRHRIMGVDVAYEGDDDSAFVVRKGTNVEEVEFWHGNDVTETSNIVIDRYNEMKAAGKAPRWVVIDATGIGSGVYSNCRHAGLPAVPCKAQERAPETDGYMKADRIRSWLWWQARRFYRDYGVHWCGTGETWDRLRDELLSPHYKYKGGVVVVEDKETLKKLYGRKSPDLADAHNLTFYMDPFLTGTSVVTKAGEKRKRFSRRPPRTSLERWKVI